MKLILTFLVALASSGFVFATQQSPDKDGFIRNWLILAPIAMEEENEGAAELNKKQLKDEGNLQPKEGEEATIGAAKMKWKVHQTADFFIDFVKYAQGGKGEQVVAYAVTYIVADEEMKGVKAKIGSNDQAKLYVNGTQVIAFEDTRTLEKDQNVSNGFTLNKGVNTIVFKVVNQENNWQGCLRFVDASDKVLTGLKVKLMP